MTRQDLQELAEMRLADAESLLAAGRYSGAYYLAGYAVECAITACIARHVKEHDFPDKKTVLDSYTHDLTQLLRVAKLDVKEPSRSRNAFAENWLFVKDWTEDSRYRSWTEQQARLLFAAIDDSVAGILLWLKHHW